MIGQMRDTIDVYMVQEKKKMRETGMS